MDDDTVLKRPPGGRHMQVHAAACAVLAANTCLSLPLPLPLPQESFKFYADKLKEKADKARTKAED